MISVIVIGKNEETHLAHCFQSVHDSLGMLKHEVIYVDSRSTDRSLTIAGKFGARCFLLDETDPTPGLGRFVGAKEAQGEYLLFLDGDMALCPGFCEKAMMLMGPGGADAVCGQREDVYVRDHHIVSHRVNYFNCNAQRPCPEFGGALFIKKEALERAGGWSPDTIACEESELHARLKAAGCSILEIPTRMIVHTDEVRDNRNPLSVVFSRRRLGEGQAMRCAMAGGSAKAYIAHNREKFAVFALDALCALLLIACIAAWIAAPTGIAGPVLLLAILFIQMMQLGYFIAKRRPRAFVSAKLLFFAFLPGMASYRARNRGYAPVAPIQRKR